MNHSALIGPGLPVIGKGAAALGMKPLPKGVATGQFLQTMLATMQPVRAVNAVLQKPGDREANVATSGESVQIPALMEPMTDTSIPPAALAPIHSEVVGKGLMEHIPIVIPAESVGGTKETKTALALPSTGSPATKKSSQKEGGTVTPELGQMHEAAAPVLAIVPRELPGKAPLDSEGPTQEVPPELRVAVLVRQGMKDSGSVPVATFKASKTDGRKADAIDATVGHVLRTESVAPNIPSVALIGSHDAAHSVRDVSAMGGGVTVVGNVASVATHSGSVAKTAGVVAPHVEATTQATDLKTLVATPNVLEVGVASGVHGWLKVRAEFAQTGEVAASVVAGSASAAQSLHRELPGISAYLAGEHVGVSSLVVNSAERGAGAQTSTLGSGTGGAATADDGRSRSGRDLTAAVAKGQSRDAELSVDTSALLGAAGMDVPVVLHANGSGSWLSVRV